MVGEERPSELIKAALAVNQHSQMVWDQTSKELMVAVLLWYDLSRKQYKMGFILDTEEL